MQPVNNCICEHLILSVPQNVRRTSSDISRNSLATTTFDVFSPKKSRHCFKNSPAPKFKACAVRAPTFVSDKVNRLVFAQRTSRSPNLVCEHVSPSPQVVFVSVRFQNYESRRSGVRISRNTLEFIGCSRFKKHRKSKCEYRNVRFMA